MDPLILTVGKTVSRDVHELVHATQLETPSVTELEPPNILPRGTGMVRLAVPGSGSDW